MVMDMCKIFYCSAVDAMSGFHVIANIFLIKLSCWSPAFLCVGTVAVDITATMTCHPSIAQGPGAGGGDGNRDGYRTWVSPDSLLSAWRSS